MTPNTKTAEQEACEILETITNDDNGIDSIKALASLISDKRRLDWLQTHLDAIKIDCNLAFEEPFVITFERSVVGYNKRAGFKGRSLRETIDAAMKEREGK